MRRIRCAGVIFRKGDKILLEDRRRISKHGEHWSFFGGAIERGETIKHALIREIKEELGYKLESCNFFIKHHFQVNDLDLTYFMFLADMPDIKRLKVHKGAGLKVVSIKKALTLKMAKADKFILRKLATSDF